MTLGELVPSLRTSLSARLDRDLWPSSARADCAGELWLGELPVSHLAAQYGTPCYLLDLDDVRLRCREYRQALSGVEIAYASKAFLCATMVRLLRDEGLSLDVCSSGELALAVAAGYPPERILLHGNAKTPEDLKAALSARVGRIVVDSLDEIEQLAALARRRQDVLVRVVPEVTAGGHRSVVTGIADQKFGFGLGDGAALTAVEHLLRHPNLRLVGLHCHLGSQISSVAPYELAARRMVGLLAELNRRFGVQVAQLNLGGGHGIRYTAEETRFDLAGFANRVPDAVRIECSEHRVRRPALTVEPGRAIVGPAAIAVYRVAAVKHRGEACEPRIQHRGEACEPRIQHRGEACEPPTRHRGEACEPRIQHRGGSCEPRLEARPGGRTFVAVNGGMSDNPRPALYGSRYTARLVGRPLRARSTPMTVVGRHCEAGDVLAVDAALPEDVHAGDVLALAASGAYQCSMASSYNLVGRPPVVGISGGEHRLLLRREREVDLFGRDVDL